MSGGDGCLCLFLTEIFGDGFAAALSLLPDGREICWFELMLETDSSEGLLAGEGLHPDGNE